MHTDNEDTKWLYIIGAFAVLLGASLTMGLFLLFLFKDKIIDKNDINLLDMYIKASFSFFGSLFSIGTSLFIFHLQNNRKKKDKKDEKLKIIDFIRTLNHKNITEAKKIHEMISTEGMSIFLSDLNNNDKEIIEIFTVIHTSINTKSIDSLMLTLNPMVEEDLKLINQYNLICEIEKLLFLFIEKINTESGREESIKQLNSLSESIE